jgi:hypothetical protein
MVVYLPGQRPAVHADGRTCTWVYETTNETERRRQAGWRSCRTAGSLPVAGLVMMATGGAGLIPTALLFCSLRLFGRPKFLMSQNTRGGGPAARHNRPEH